MSQAITVTTRPDSVAVLTFDQPGSKANVLTRELWAEFGESLAGLATRTDLKGLVLASAKPGIFIAGADLKLLANAPGPNDPEVRAFIEQGLRVLEQLEALPFPTCAAIDGAALGGGLEVALACDYRVCGTNPKVQLGLPEVKLGLIPGWGGTQRLPRVIPLYHARKLLQNGDTVDGARACALGLAASPVATDPLAEAIRLTLTATKPDWGERRRVKREAVWIEDDKDLEFPSRDLPTAQYEVLRVICLGAVVPFNIAIKLETEAFMRLAGSEESKRLIAEFFTSRKK